MKEYIERRNLIETYCRDNCGNRRCRDAWDKCTFISYVLEEPTADVKEVVHAKWFYSEGDIQCSACGFICEDSYYFSNANYCPECGAKMDLA